MERGPRLLKDCLLEDSNSCSSNGFKSFPRQPLQPCPFKPKKESKKTLQAVINAVKSFRFNAFNGVKSAPSILPRSLSRKLSKKHCGNKASKGDITVRVKDIVRWRSSRDLNKDVSPPSDFEPSTVTTTTTGSTTSSTPCSSWCDSDFTWELLPSWGGKFQEYGEKGIGKERCEMGRDLQCVGEDSSTEAKAATVADTKVGPEEDLQCDGDSPVSVLEIQYDEDDEASDSSFGQCLDNVERTKQKLMQTIKRFETLAQITPFNLEEWVSVDEDSCNEDGAEADIVYNDDNYNSVDSETEDEEEAGEVEEKAQQLWSQVKEGRAIWIHEEHLIMDFLRDEAMRRLNSHHETYRDQEFENQLVAQAKKWICGQRDSEIEHGSIEQKRKACLRESEREDWNARRMKEEGAEVAVEIEDRLFNLLLDEMLTELYHC